jgi:hypothetical protein
MNSITNLKNLHLFLIVIGISILTALLANHLLMSDALFYDNFAEQLTAEKIESILAQMHKWAWLNYIMIPLVYLIKFTLVSLVLLTGFFFFDKTVDFSQIFKAVILAEIAFLLVPIINLCWFVFVQTKYTFQDVQYFYPLSALQLFDAQSLPKWQIYPLQLFNVFELIYWVLLAYWLKKLLNISLNKSMEVVASSYGTGLLLWVVFITFLSLNAA